MVPANSSAPAAGECSADLTRRGCHRRGGRRCPTAGSPSASATTDAVIGPDAAGTFAGYGVDVPVALSPGGARAPARTAAVRVDRRLGARPGQARPRMARGAACTPRTTASTRRWPRPRVARRDRRGADPIGVLVVADGAHTLTPPAPGGYDPDSVPVQAALDDALGRGRRRRAGRAARPIVGRVACQVLAGLRPAPRRRAAARASSTAARPTASATSPASGTP